jgi:maltooligosyltrehalose trehalohydrolase
MPDEHAAEAPLGATVADGGVDFRVWSPDAARLEVEVRDLPLVAMRRGANDIWHAHIPDAGAGARYRYRIDDRWSYPDPYSRSQPDGVHGESEVVDPAAFAWHDGRWTGRAAHGLVIYEMHIGALTEAGTFDAATAQIDALAELGVNAIELLPVAEFPGERNWGYDGVDLFAPSHVYGGPDALKRLVDAAHARGIGVILDAVYNHFGPDGSYLTEFARDYLTDRHETPWGDAVNFDGAHAHMVRRLVLDNARYWVREYHVDGIRIDAAFTFKDDSPRHILAELTSAARAAAGERTIVMIAETYENDLRYLRLESAGGRGFDAVWADDFHHVVHARVTHDRGGYYADYEGTIEELARTINRGWLYEGQQSKHFGAARGTSSQDVPAAALVYCIENHDQIANRAFGRRMSEDMTPALYRAWSALLLLLPYTPLIFMGQEYAATTPYRNFTDHHGELGASVSEGLFAQFALHESADERRKRFPNPQDPATFLASKLDPREQEQARGRDVRALYKALLRLRREDAALRQQDRMSMHAHAIDDDALIVEMGGAGQRRLLVLALSGAIDVRLADLGGGDLADTRWRVAMSTDEARFGGEGSGAAVRDGVRHVPRECAVWLAETE